MNPRPVLSKMAAATVMLLIAALAVPLASADSAVAGSALRSAGLLDGRFPTSELFVDQAYQDVLGRSADAAGLAFWSELIESGTSPDALYNELVTSAEFGGTVAPVSRLYYSVFGRQPDLAGLRFWIAVRNGGATLEELAAEFVASNEFAALSAAQTDVEVVEAVYGRVLGRTPDAAGLAYWVDLIDTARLTVPGFVVAVSESPEHQTRRNADILVTTVYLGLLQRLPEPSGAQYWGDQVRGGASLTALIAPAMGSDEYLNRFPLGPQPEITVLSEGFTIPWDVAPLPDGSLLATERGSGFWLVNNGSRQRVAAPMDDLFAAGETGLMGVTLDPDFSSNRRFYSCQGHASPREIQVIAWALSGDGLSATRTADPLVPGLPVSSGRHGGCRLTVTGKGDLIIGTGDAAIGSLPQNLTSLGGKVLRVDRFSGEGVAANPFADSANANTRRILSYGHRNVQGVGIHPVTGEVWTAEHGPSRDDEINRIVPGGNYGWNPVPGYNEAVPMTDTAEFPAAVQAAWSSGSPTLAVSGLTFLQGERWGSWENAAVVASLKNSSLRIMFFTDDGRYRGQQTLIDGEYGRLRGVVTGSDGTLYVTTSNGGGRDQILAIG